MAQKKCNHCGKYKDEEEFNWRLKSLRQRNKTCRDCQHWSNRFHIRTIRLRFLYTTGITAGFITTSRYNGARKRSPAPVSWVCY